MEISKDSVEGYLDLVIKEDKIVFQDWVSNFEVLVNVGLKFAYTKIERSLCCGFNIIVYRTSKKREKLSACVHL